MNSVTAARPLVSLWRPIARLFKREIPVERYIVRANHEWAIFQQSIKCTCGWSYHHSRNEGHEASAFARRMGEHLQSVGEKAATVVAGDLPPSPATTAPALSSAFMCEAGET